MIVVTVELWPGGNPDRAKEIGVMHIANDSNLADVSDYIAKVESPAVLHLEVPAVNKTVQITDHPRRSSVWSLIRKVLEKANA